MESLDEFDVVEHEGEVCITPDGNRIIKLADVDTVRRVADDDIADRLP